MSYQALKLDGNGYASISDASQKGLDMGLSDFMIEGWVKLASTGRILNKNWDSASNAYIVWIDGTTGKMKAGLKDATPTSVSGFISDIALNDNTWHYIAIVFDRSGNLEGFIDGSIESTSVDISTANKSLDNSSEVRIGRYTAGFLDEIRIWNFGKDGLPTDYESYISWRYKHPFADISEYDSGAWNGYADADRTELLTNGDMEATNSWTNRGTPTTNARSDEQAHGGTYSRKIVTDAVHEGAYQDITTEVGKWYEVDGYIYVSAGDAKIGKENTDGSDQVLTSQATLGEWKEFAVVFQATETTSRIFFQSDTTAASTFYVDDISVKRIGLVAHYKFNGDYTDETSNSNDLTAGGTGNTFPGYTLKKDKIIKPGVINIIG